MMLSSMPEPLSKTSVKSVDFIENTLQSSSFFKHYCDYIFVLYTYYI